MIKQSTITVNFDHHADAGVLCGVHCPMEYIPGFIRSHWMPQLGNCRISPSVVMDDVFVVKLKTLTKSYFLLANLWKLHPHKIGYFQAHRR